MKKLLKKEICITPAPQEWHLNKGFFTLYNSAPIFTESNFLNTAKSLKSKLQTDYNISLNIFPLSQVSLETPGIYLLSSDTHNNFIKLLNADELNFTPQMEEEGYILIIKRNRIVLISKSPRGAFYGIQSLQFLITIKAKKIVVPGISIRDWPDMKIRGFSDDISRGQVSTLDHFKRIIRYLAHYKMNVYMLYLEDLFQFKSYSSIGKNRGALSVQECIELQDYAAQYYVEIIPIFQTLGHYENLLIQPEFIHLADFPGAASLNISSPDTYLFLEKLLDEIVPVFRSIYFHMGADESYDVGSGASRKDVEKKGVAAVHASHYNKVYKILKKYGKKIIMYGDIVLEYPDILQDLPRDIIIMDWHYDVKNHYDSTDLFKKSGLPFIVSPGNQNWSRIFPELEHSIQNIHQFIQNGHFNGASGAITSSWGDFGGANLRELNYYQIAYAANCAWNKNNNDITQFNKSFFRDFYGSDDPGFANAYHILSHISEYYDLNYLYSHPFYQPVSEIDKLNGRSIELEQIYKKLNIKLQRLRTIAKRNKTHLDILEFCGTLYHWTALLNQLQIALYKAQKSSSDLLIKQITLLENKLTGIKSTFKTLWLRYNKEDNLHKIIELMDRVQKYLLIKKAEIQTGNLEFNGRLESPFISFPLNKKTKNFNPVIYLRKKFILNESINATWLQAIADSHATIWINEHYIGELVATRTLSAVVEAERVKMWEVSKYLKKGENILAVKVINYKCSGNASVNIFLNCPEVNSRIKGDETWKAYNREEKNWQALDFAAQHWENAVKSENNWIISRPYFDHQLTSRIEFFKNPIY